MSNATNSVLLEKKNEKEGKGKKEIPNVLITKYKKHINTDITFKWTMYAKKYLKCHKQFIHL